MSSELGLMPHLDLPSVPLTQGPTGHENYNFGASSTTHFDASELIAQNTSTSAAVSVLTEESPTSNGINLQIQHNQIGSGGSMTTTPRVIDYTEEFPALAQGQNTTTETTSSSSPFVSREGSPAPNKWGQPTPKPRKVASTNVTQVFHLPAEERRHLNDHQFGERTTEQQECNEIMQNTGTHIELCESKDHSLTIVVSGKRQLVEEARIQVVKRLQTQATREISIPKDHHRVIIGKEGKKLQDLEHVTACRILIPKRDSLSDVIKISGPREGIDRAVHEIQQISDEQSKLAQERLTIPKFYYPWIKGPYNETLDSISQRTGARINIPPPSASSDVIIITGEKEGVYQASAEIKAIFEERQKNCQTVSIQVAQEQHKYVAGPQRSGIADILKETGISVELPPEDSDSNTITLRGDPTKLGTALALVYAKASSIIQDVVTCPSWLHRFIIGPKGQNIKKIVGDPPTVSVMFNEDNEGIIIIEGPPTEVKTAKASLAELSAQLQQELTFEILHIPSACHRHVIGRSGANINRIKDETGVLVNIPEESTHSDEVRLEGKKEMVVKAKAMILEIVNRVENEKARDIIIDQRFHGQIIGSKGEAIRDLRDKFPGVNISFPEHGRKSDVVTLRGPKDEVDKLYKHLQHMIKEMIENNFQIRVPIFKDFHKIIIGKGGQNIRKIREETDTRIDLPAEGSETDVIVITGKKANAEKAKDMLTKIQNELASIVTVEVSVPRKVHSQLLYGGGRLIHSIADECGGVNIKFPAENSNSDIIAIRGPKDDAEKAKKLLNQLAKDKELASFQAEVKAKADLFRYLIGRGGGTIRKVRDAHPNVRILLPRPQDEDQETIHLMGKKEDVELCKKTLEDTISDLNKIVEIQMDVDPKWHRHFVARRAAELRDIQEQFGGVIISFPRQGTNSSLVVLKGSKDCAEGARKRIQEIVDDLEAQISIDIIIPHTFHRNLLGNRGARVQDICHECKVQIKFPDRPDRENETSGPHTAHPQEGHLMNGVGSPDTLSNGISDSTKGGDHTADPRDVVTVTGRAENCELAKEKLEALVPVTQTLNVPYDFHRFLIGSKGDGVRKIMREYEVNIHIPPKDDHCDEISVSGPQQNVRDAIAHLMKAVEGLEDEQKDKELRSFKLSVDVPQELHSKLIGPRGTNINRIRQQFDVNISIPKAEDPNPDRITITGYEKNAEATKLELEKMVKDMQSQFTQEITLDARVHSRLIGPKGRNVRKVMDDYDVEIRFPRQSDPDPNLVVVSGSNEDSVYDCIDHLRNMEEEFLQDVVDKYAYRHPQFPNGDNNQQKTTPSGLIIKNAPWDSSPPDVKNLEDFPSMASGSDSHSTGTSSVSGAWGRKY